MSETAVQQPEAQPTVAIVDHFKNLVDLMAIYSAASNELKTLNSETDGLYLELIDDKRPEYAKYQKALIDSQEAMELICRANPGWFAEKRSISTPYGEVKFHRSSKLNVENEELTILLIEKRAEKDPTFDASQYIVEKRTLNLENLEKLDEETLKKLRVEVDKKDNFSVKEATVDMGKAIKSSDDKKAKEEKAAQKAADKEAKKAEKAAAKAGK